ncbi:MAG: methylated-DNA--[protein]-cysteine S-methyltransferase [Bacilli bacterium]|nr:methylated-DNA--[protein]-cysteine S-methyltransferase [Bacilli bacterium]MBN2696885.1 methylated-DNA--[protein]-cysteine S-methyltransferase [Bacilli bacterium]
MTDRTVFLTLAGKVEIVTKDEYVTSICIVDNIVDLVEPQTAICQNAKRQIEEYFAHERSHFDLAYNLDGTEFFKSVLKTLAKVPYGETISYKELALRSGYPRASRAVGSVMRKNPLPIVIPCHRVILANGDIGSFTGGVRLKKLLLDHEK